MPKGSLNIRRNNTSPNLLCRTLQSRLLQGKTIEMYMPALSSTMEEGTIVQWLKEVGDRIEVWTRVRLCV